MIEVVSEGKLPKNIRQIGQVSGNQKVYLEDYVITYLKQIPSPEEAMRIIILYGKKEMIEDELCWFISGGIAAEKDFFMERTVIDQDAWQRVNDLAGKYFPEHSVLGWGIVANEPTKDIEEQILRTQRQFFRQDQKIYFEYNTEEKEEYLYLFEKGKMKQQSGYYIYYERNECMQNYMVSLRSAERHPEEFESDRATQQFRNVVTEKKQEVSKRRSTSLMTCATAILALVIIVIGITLLNNYEKMQNMEQVLYQISGKIDKDTQEAIEMEEVSQEQTENLSKGLNREAEVDLQAEQTLALQETQAQPVEQAAPTVTKEELQMDKENAQIQADSPNNIVMETEKEEVQQEEVQQEEVQQEEVVTTQEVAEATQKEPSSYVVQKGDTLAKICMKYYGNLSNVDAICEMNGIENKDNIFYGQKIFLP